ncbi:unnamed protein product [Diamesa serratosioi]
MNEENVTILNELYEASTKRPNSATLNLYSIFIPALGVLIITLNLFVVVSSGLILKKGQQPRSTYLFLGNVALSDLLTGIAVLFGHFFPRKYRCEMSCSIQIGMIVSATLVSVFSVGLIAFDRFLFILYGLQYQRYIYPTRSRILIFLTWLLAIIVGFLPTMGWRGDTQNGRICWFILLAPPNLILITAFLGLIPIFIVLILYGIILYKALKKVAELKKATSARGAESSNNLRIFRGSNLVTNQTNHLHSETPLTPQKKQPKGNLFSRCCIRNKVSNDKSTAVASKREPSKWKAIKVVMLTTGSFFFTWVPWLIASIMFVYCDPETNPAYCNGLKLAIASPLAILGFANSLLNPIIYAWWHNGFRQTSSKIFYTTIARIRCCNNSTDESEFNSQLQQINNLSTQTTSTIALSSYNNPTNDIDSSETNSINDK